MWYSLKNYVRPETLKLLEENVGGNFLNVVLQGFFLDMTPQA